MEAKFGCQLPFKIPNRIIELSLKKTVAVGMNAINTAWNLAASILNFGLRTHQATFPSKSENAGVGGGMYSNRVQNSSRVDARNLDSSVHVADEKNAGKVI